jgi:hydrogenase nickel incorporation protein HypA/HybF
MHEVSLCHNIIQILQQHFAEKIGITVKTIYLEVGCDSCVEKSALTFAFPMVAANSIAAKAQLSFIDIPGREIQIKEVAINQAHS